MIFVNNSWGTLLAEAHAVGLYRIQSNGKVKMSTQPGEHQGLGLSHYLWASSPLRRYSDLVNQRQ
jgi:exoribonuclease-2